MLRVRPELHLFERDPREAYADLVTDPTFHPWAANLRTPTVAGINSPPWELPADLVVPYGDNFVTDPYPAPVSIAALHEQDFLVKQPATVSVPWAAGPTTALSQWDEPSLGAPDKTLADTRIRAGRVVALPECSASVNIQNDFFSQLAGQLGGFGCMDGKLQAHFTAASYLTHDDPNQPNVELATTQPIFPFAGVYGGIMLSGFVSIASQLGLAGCDVDFTYEFRYALAKPCPPGDLSCGLTASSLTYVDNDGILTVKPVRIFLSSTDSFQCQHDQTILGEIPSVVSSLTSLLEQQLPATIFQQASLRQGIPGPDIVPPGSPWNGTISNPNDYQCDPVSTDEIADKCSAAMAALDFAANTGAGQLGIVDTNGITAAMDDPRNWTCRPATQTELSYDCSVGTYKGGRCEFVLPASSVIAEPDEVRLAWAPLDELKISATTCTNDAGCPRFGRCNTAAGFCEDYPSSVAFAASFATSAGGATSTAYEGLCTPAVTVRQSQPYYQRYFASFDQAVCAPQPPPLSPPCPTGLTACGGACVNLETDFSNCGACGNACPSNSTVSRYGHFVCSGGACTPALACACSTDGDCVEILGNGARCTSGACTP